VVATDVGEVPRLVDDGVTGFVVSRGDQVALANRLRTLLQEPALCLQFGRAGRRKAEDQFGLEGLVTRTLDAYRSAGWTESHEHSLNGGV
jgi:glycosyltransferase involved in cell wall biosynthesis